MIEVPVAMEMEATLVTGMIIQIAEPAKVKDNRIISIIKGVDKITHIEVNEDSGMEMTPITVTETIGIEILTVKVIVTGVEDGIIITTFQSKSLSSTTNGTSIQIPNPIWPIFIPPTPTTISITNANSISTSYKYLSVVS